MIIGLRRSLAVLALTGALAACGSSSGDDAATTTTTTPAGSSTSTTVSGPSSTTATTGEAGTSTTAGASTTTTSPLAEATDGPKSGPQVGDGTALLTAVRTGRHDGFERVVFEFKGAAVPGYRVRWIDGPVTSDGSGEPVRVDGDAYLEIGLEPASGVDMESGTPVYQGSDRVSVPGSGQIVDLVRTGDFEAVLTWVVGARQRTPFKVSTLRSPSRVVIDVATKP